MWYGVSAPILKHRPPTAQKCAETCFVLKMGIRLAYTSVNICIHSSNVRQNRAVFGYVIDSIAQYGSGEPLGATGDASGGDVISFLLVLDVFSVVRAWGCTIRSGTWIVRAKWLKCTSDDPNHKVYQLLGDVEIHVNGRRIKQTQALT